jgi:hypothetical protein
MANDDCCGGTGLADYAAMPCPNPLCPAVRARLTFELKELHDLLQEARGYTPPTTGTHEAISAALGWCDCGYCTHVPKEPPSWP